MSGQPSLRSLKVFAEVARMGSAAGAAGRLGVTASAVSHGLSELEAQLGQPLFADRRQAKLNEAGRRLAERLQPAFDAIDMAVAESRRPHREIRLSTLSSFALLWLIPRLPRLRALLPTVDILLSTDTRQVDLAVESYDCVIRWGREGVAWAGLERRLLFRECLVMVASPRLGDDPSRLPVLAARSRLSDWDHFPARSGSFPDKGGATVFETRGQMIEAAVAGLGVAVIDRHLVEGALAAGLLRQIAGHRVERPDGYYLAARPAAWERHDLRVLRSWLLREAGGEA